MKADETVVDLGSGSGMDTFIAALKVGPHGKVIGVDMTDEQRAKAERLRDRDGFLNVSYVKGYIEEAPLPDGVADVVNRRSQFGLSRGVGGAADRYRPVERPLGSQELDRDRDVGARKRPFARRDDAEL
jgi:SAM-dependent methyltransferase